MPSVGDTHAAAGGWLYASAVALRALAKRVAAMTVPAPVVWERIKSLQIQVTMLHASRIAATVSAASRATTFAIRTSPYSRVGTRGLDAAFRR